MSVTMYDITDYTSIKLLFMNCTVEIAEKLLHISFEILLILYTPSTNWIFPYRLWSQVHKDQQWIYHWFSNVEWHAVDYIEHFIVQRVDNIIIFNMLNVCACACVCLCVSECYITTKYRFKQLLIKLNIIGQWQWQRVI